ncbi:hypothetical protein Lal_00027239 [Lupinus albus]|nr:hypothetical protein Lal_00027239 [Lupinus albus]
MLQPCLLTPLAISDMEDMNLLVKKFSKFLMRIKGTKADQSKRFTKSNEASTSDRTSPASIAENLNTSRWISLL